MKWFLDTEFDENGSTIKLISIALVSEYGQAFYAVAADGWREEDCDDWVKANVVAKLPPRETWTPREHIAAQVRALLLGGGQKERPEIWAYFADYDWVVFCQLFGRMIDLPKGMPMYCRDLKQEMDRLGVTKEQLPPQPENAHDALADARWVREAWMALRARG